MCDKLKSLLAWDNSKVKPNAAVVHRAKKEGKTMVFANLVDVSRLKNAELAKNSKYKGCVVLWEDVNDECGYRAVFIGQGASGWQRQSSWTQNSKFSWYDSRGK